MALGLSSGLGIGLNLGNMGQKTDLEGPFNQYNLAVGVLSVSYAFSGDYWLLSVGVARSIGLSASQYSTVARPTLLP